MAEAVVIKKGYTEGGRGIGSGVTARHKPLERVFRAVAEDLVGGRAAEIASADVAAAPGAYDQAHIQTIVDLVNELKSALNTANGTAAAPVLPAGGAGPYDLSAAGALVLTVEVDGVNREVTFQAVDFANVAAATAAELAGAINSRGALAEAGVTAVDNGGTLELHGRPGSDRSLKGVAGGANASLGFSTTAVSGTGFVPKLTTSED